VVYGVNTVLTSRRCSTLQMLQHLCKHDLHEGCIEQIAEPKLVACKGRTGCLSNAAVSHPSPLEMSEPPSKDEEKHKTHATFDLNCA